MERIIKVIVDDVTGEEGAAPTVVPELKLDLTDESHAKLMEALAPYLDAARVKVRRYKGSTIATPAPVTATPGATPRRVYGAEKLAAHAARQALIAWARTNGYGRVSDRGYVKRAITDAYNKAMAEAASAPAPTPTPAPVPVAPTPVVPVFSAPEPAPKLNGSKPKPTPVKTTTLPAAVPPSVVRKWWKENGARHGLNPAKAGGKIPFQVVEAYNAAHQLGDALMTVDVDTGTADLVEANARKAGTTS